MDRLTKIEQDIASLKEDHKKLREDHKSLKEYNNRLHNQLKMRQLVYSFKNSISAEYLELDLKKSLKK
jgi:hypothetical protein